MLSILILSPPHLLSSSSFIILFLYNSSPLSTSSFIIQILYHPQIHPHPLSSSSFIILILYNPLPLQSFSFINLIFYHPDPLSSSNSSSSFFIVTIFDILILIVLIIFMSRIILIIINIKQDVLDGRAAAGIEPGTFSPGVFWRARAPKNAPPTRQNLRLAQVQQRSPKSRKKKQKITQAEKTKNNFWQNGGTKTFIGFVFKDP